VLRTDVVKSGTITSLRALTQEVDLMVSGLSAATAYDVWFVAEDKAGAHTRPLLSSTWAFSDTMCTLNTP